MKPEVVDGKHGADLIAIDCEKSDNWLLRNEMEIGSGTKCVLASKADDTKKTSIQKVFEDHDHIPERSSASELCYTARSTVFTSSVQKSRSRKSGSWTVVSTHEKSDHD